MKEVYVVGSFSTPFKRWPEKSIKELTRMAFMGVLEDSGIKAEDIEFSWFSNCLWGNSVPPANDDPGIKGQENTRGHVAFAPLVNEGIFPERVPCINVEGGCASGSLALHGAWKDILSGQCEVSLAMGVEKTYSPIARHMPFIMESFGGGTDQELLPILFESYKKLSEVCGKTWNPAPNRTIFMDTYATQAAWHMWKWGTTQEQLAIVASKNHFHGSLNPMAQYQFEVPVNKVLEDYEVSWPLTRSMCAPLGDGAAAAILCSREYLKGLPSSVQKRACKVLASTVTSGREKDISEPTLSYWAAQKAYNMCGIGPQDIDVTELHDATAFSEILQPEMLGLCDFGKGGKLAESGETRYDGKIPINTSGGLESKGHPIGATGLSQINEIMLQLRGEAEKRQVKKAEIGMVENGGGVVSFEEFCCAVTILQKSDM